jgi:hypothetical protein
MTGDRLQLLSGAAFGRLVGCSRMTVSKALADGRLVRSMDPAARVGIDPEHDLSIAFADDQTWRRAEAGLPPSPWEVENAAPDADTEEEREHTDADALAVGRRILALPEVERRILELLLGRLEMGLDEYGCWPEPREDPRNLEREMLEEAVDFVAYGAAALLRVRTGGES